HNQRVVRRGPLFERVAEYRNAAGEGRLSQKDGKNGEADARHPATWRWRGKARFLSLYVPIQPRSMRSRVTPVSVRYPSEPISACRWRTPASGAPALSTARAPGRLARG